MKQKRNRVYWIWMIGVVLLVGLLGLTWNLSRKYTAPVTQYTVQVGDFSITAPAVGMTSTTMEIEWSLSDVTGVVGYDVYVNDTLTNTIRPEHAGDSLEPRVQLIDLQPDTVYMVQVKAINAAGESVYTSSKVPYKTLPKEPRLEATAYGAVGDGVTDNTQALQKAIRDTPAGGVLHIAKGVYRTGALFLHSYMTLDLDEGAVLMAVDESSAFVKPNYVVTGGTPYLGILNLQGDETGPIERVVIRGGVIDGRGWKEPVPRELEIEQEVEKIEQDALEEYGVLSRSEVEAAMRRGASYEKGSSTRSSLIEIQHGKEIVLERVVLKNAPAHMVKAAQVEQMYMKDVQMQGMYSGDGLHWDGHNLVMSHVRMEQMQQGVVVAAGDPTGTTVTEQWNAYRLHISNSQIGLVFSNTGNTWIQHVYLQGLVMEDVGLAVRVRETATIGGGIRNIIVRDSTLRRITEQIDLGVKRINPVDWGRTTVELQTMKAQVPEDIQQ